MQVALTMLATVAQYRRYARIEAAQHDDLEPLILDLIVENTARIWQRLGFDQSSQVYNERLDVDNPDQMEVVPSYGPVTAVHAMTITDVGDNLQQAVQAADIFFDAWRIGASGPIGAQIAGRYQDGPMIGEGIHRLHVCYTAGASSTELAPLQLALKCEVSAVLMSLGYEDVKVSREGRASYSFTDSGWCRRAESILMEWGS